MKNYMDKITGSDFGLDVLITTPFSVLANNFTKFLMPMGIYFGMFLLFAGIGFVFTLISGLNISEIEAVINNPNAYSSADLEAIFEPIVPAVTLTILVAVPVFLVLSVFIDNILTVTSAKILRGEEVSNDEVLKISTQRLPAAIATTFAVLFVVIALYAVFALMYVVGAFLGPLFLCVLCFSIFLIVPAILYLTANLMFANTVTVLEPVAFFSALGRNMALVKDKIGKIMLYLVAIFLVGLVLSIPLGIFNFVLQIGVEAVSFSPGLALLGVVVTSLISWIINFIVQVIYSIGRTAWYFNLAHAETNVEPNS